jgi:hypothetical protein
MYPNRTWEKIVHLSSLSCISKLTETNVLNHERIFENNDKNLDKHNKDIHPNRNFRKDSTLGSKYILPT